jgi:hypothetical protein
MSQPQMALPMASGKLEPALEIGRAIKTPRVPRKAKATNLWYDTPLDLHIPYVADLATE